MLEQWGPGGGGRGWPILKINFSIEVRDGYVVAYGFMERFVASQLLDNS